MDIRWVVSIILLHLSLFFGSVDGQDLYDHEDFPDKLDPTHIKIIVALVVVTGGATIIAIAVSFKRKLHLPVVLLIVIWTALFTVGIVTWLITYITTRDAVLDKCEMLVASYGADVRQHVEREFAVGILAIESVRQFAGLGLFMEQGAPLWPGAQAHLERAGLSAGMVDTLSKTTLRMINDDGYERTLSMRRDGDTLLYRHTISTLETSHLQYLPPTLICKPVDKEPYCQTMTGCDLIWETESCGIKCNVSATAPGNCVKGYVGFHTCSEDRHSAFFNVTHSVKHYDAVTESWYRSVTSKPETNYIDKNITWFDPNRDNPGNELLYRGAVPFMMKTGPATSVIAAVSIEYSLATLGVELRRLQPQDTEGSVIVSLVTYDWQLVATSLTDVELVNDICGPSNQYYNPAQGASVDTPLCIQLPRSVRSIYKEDSKIKMSVYTVNDKYNSIETTQPSLHMEESDAVMAVPIKVGGEHRMLLTMVLPYSDVLGQIDQGSIAALIFAVSLSAICGAVTYAVVWQTLKPLKALGISMSKVASMKFDASQCIQEAEFSRIREVASMQESFRKMATNLEEYRRYLPHSVLCLDTDSNSRRSSDRHPNSDTPPTSVLEISTDTDNSMPSDSEPCDGPTQRQIAERKKAERRRDRDRGRRSRGDKSYRKPANAPSSSSRANPVNPLSRKTRAFCVALKRRSISLACVNVKGFLNVAENVNRTELLAVHSRYVGTVAGYVKSYRGVVDTVSGDKIVASFNAVLHCGSHRSTSAKCVHAIRQLFARDPLTAGDGKKMQVATNSAVASGAALCGNLGLQGLKRYNMLGRVASSVRVMERLGSSWDVSVLVDNCVAEAMKGFAIRAVCKVWDGRRETMLSEVVRSGDTSTYSDYNKALECIYAARFPAAEALIKKVAIRYPDEPRIPPLAGWLHECIRLQRAPAPLPIYWLYKLPYPAPIATWGVGAMSPRGRAPALPHEATLPGTVDRNEHSDVEMH